MEFRRSGQRDDRRRRVLLDETPQDQDAPGDDVAPSRGGAARGAVQAPRYAETARADKQPPLTALIPTRPWTVAVVLLLGLVAIAAIEALYVLVLQSPRIARSVPLTPLDVAAPGSLAAWFASLLLFATSVGAVMVYSIRRHRLDDYRGRYRIWLPVAGILLFASLDASCGWHHCLGQLLAGLTDRTLLGTADEWWLGLYGVAYLGLAIRLGMEVRECRLSLVSLGAATAMYALAALCTLPLAATGVEFLDHVLRSTATLLGHLALATVILTEARYVYLDAQGLVVPRVRREPRGEDKPAKPKVAKKTATSSAAPAVKRGRAKSAPQPAAADSDAAPLNSDSGPAKPAPGATTLRVHAKAEEEDVENDGLSKSERRRLRKLQRRDGRQAA